MKKTSLFVIIIFFFSCNKVKETAKETINKSGEAVGKTATEFVEGVTEGVDRSLDCTIKISDKLTSKGLKTGKFSIENDSLGGKNNKVVIYFIFDKNFNEEISIKTFDKKDLEAGRTKLLITGKVGEAKYYDIIFDKRTNIETKSSIKID
ncbi:hypothetical protein OX283_009815 [Flavobacterium sp. SUN052]|uniref:hypothetical protein n=1 Tax=Flavobacterium sp. SUN052 TaxID=3002441 RepID=UPI00237E6B1B|nr:hypothetical protein [Flavobacterium sp. SUN052]MEC4004952.1 hypothetical protein [Flavobacterium sp. SUN052]